MIRIAAMTARSAVWKYRDVPGNTDCEACAEAYARSYDDGEISGLEIRDVSVT